MTRAGIATALVLASIAGVSADAPVIRVERIVLSLDGEPVAVSAGDEIVIEGTITSTHDGSEIDAFSRRTGDLDFVDAGPFIDVPDGSELIDADVTEHRYVVRIGQDGVVAFAVQRLAMQQLITRSEAAARLRGAFELARPVEVEMAVAGVTAPSPSDSSTPLWPLGVLAALGAAVVVPLRRRRDAFAPLLRRASRAQKAVAAEARRLGPAFTPVTESACRLAESVAALRDHVEETKAARARIQGTGSEATSKRLSLAEEAAESVVRAEQIVDRLEGVAAHMAAAVADHARATEVDDALSMVNADLDIALDADATARAI